MAGMILADIVDIDEALTKTGPELFKELYRIYPVADHEDYFKNGQWKNDVMKTDIMLLESHRRESGAPDVPDLEDIKFPADLPAAGPMQVASNLMHLSSGLKPTVGLGLKPAGMVMPTIAAPLTHAGAPVAVGTSVIEIRLIALFVAKWKLEPASTKAALTKLTAAQRRHVIQNFKAETTGAEAIAELQNYIAEREVDKAWDAPANGAAALATPTTGGPTLISPSGLKRPLMASPLLANKKPNFGM